MQEYQFFDRDFAEQFLHAFGQLQRLSGTPDAEKAVQLIQQRLDSLGLLWEIERFPCYLSDPISASCSIRCQGEEHSFLAYPRSFSASVPEGVQAPLFYDSRAKETLSPLEQEEWYKGVRGKIVFGENFYEDYVHRLQQYGAAGLIHFWASEEDSLHQETVCPVWGTPEPGQLKEYPPFPVVGITHQDGEKILALLGRGELTASVVSRLEYGVEECLLPVVTLPGETSEFLLIGSHYDSWFEGVTDNGTGNLLCLELARLLSQGSRRRTIKIAWWPGHSNGRYAGSTWYCDHHFAELSQSCVALLNVDSPGCKGAEIVDLTTCGFEGTAFDSLIQHHTGQREVAHQKHPRGSDLSFFGVDLPIVLNFSYNQLPQNRCWDVAGSGGGWWWHTAFDREDKVDYTILERDTWIALEIVEKLSQGDLPFDPQNYLEQFVQAIEELKENSDPEFDLIPALQAVERLQRKLENRGASLPAREAKQIAGPLNRLLYCSCDAYRYDNTFAVGKLPGLQGIRNIYRENTSPLFFLALKTQFLRQRNRFVAEIEKVILFLSGTETE